MRHSRGINGPGLAIGVLGLSRQAMADEWARGLGGGHGRYQTGLAGGGGGCHVEGAAMRQEGKHSSGEGLMRNGIIPSCMKALEAGARELVPRDKRLL